MRRSNALAGDRPDGPWWPEFHGPARDNVSPDKHLLKAWPEGGPKLAWTAPKCGDGYAGISIADGRIYTSGGFGQDEMVLALGLDGKPIWQAKNGKSWKGPHPGARTTPTFHQGVVYHMNPTGRLGAYRARTGKEVWSVELGKAFGAKPARWAMSENVIIDGNALLCAPGGEKGRIVALDKATGECLWANTDIPGSQAYASPVIVTHEGVRQLITVLQKTVVGVDVRTGKLLWSHPHTTKHDQNVTMPLYRDGHVFASSGHGTGGRLLRIDPGGKAVREVWLNKDLDNCHGGVLLLDGRLYGSGCRLFRKGFVCVDFDGGKTLWSEKALGKISLAWADGMLYGLTDKAVMSLIELSTDGCRVTGRFKLPSETRKLSLSHPVVCGGRLYVRHWNDLFAYDVRTDAAR